MDELIKGTIFISNEAINASYDYNPSEIDLMVQIMFELSRVKELTPGAAIIVGLPFTQIIHQREATNKSAYGLIHKSIKALLSKPYEIFDREKNAVILTNYIASSVYYKTRGYFEFTVTYEMARILIDVNKRFTTFEMASLLRLKSKYSKRLYMLVHQFKSTGVRFTSIEELRAMFKVGDKYTTYGEFHRRVLRPALDEINKHTEVKVEVYRAKGRHGKIQEFELTVLLKKELTNIMGDERQRAKMQYFGLSDWQIDNVFFTLNVREIAQVLHKVMLNEKNIQNPGAYLVSAFKQHGVHMSGKVAFKQLRIDGQ